MAKKPSDQKATASLFSKLENEIQSNQSRISMILGALIILVIGILVFNYFNKNRPSLGPAQQTEQTEQTPQGTPDVTQNKLPGPYTIKEGDTLFKIAEKYYADGSKFEEVAKANNLSNPDEIETGQVLQLPKLEAQAPAQAEVNPTPAPTEEAQASLQPVSEEPQSLGTGGGNTTIWGPRIEGNTYTVVEGDWLSKIAGRAYGDIFAYQKIAQANNISNPDHIEPGQVLTIPR